MKIMEEEDKYLLNKGIPITKRNGTPKNNLQKKYVHFLCNNCCFQKYFNPQSYSFILMHGSYAGCVYFEFDEHLCIN